MITATLDDPLAGVADEAWDALAGSHFYSSSGWLRFTARNADGRAGAVLCAGGTSGGGLAGAVAVTEIVTPPAALYRWSDLLAASGLPRIPPLGYMLGAAQGLRAHLLAAPGADRRQVVGTLVDGVRDLPDMGDGTARVGMYLGTEDVLAMRDAGVRALPVLLDADACFDIPDDGWDGWLHTLPYKRRVAVRREVRRFEEAGYTVVHQPLSECYPALAPLGRATQSKYGAPEPTEYYARLLKAHVDGMGDAARVAVCAREGEDPVGFCLYYVWHDTIHLRWAGFDYERTAQAAEYFNLVYYTHIMAAAHTGTRHLHAGVKAAEAKALRGAALRPLWMVDLNGDSPLPRSEREVRAHNRAVATRTLDDPRTGPAVAQPAEWSLFS